MDDFVAKHFSDQHGETKIMTPVSLRRSPLTQDGESKAFYPAVMHGRKATRRKS